MSNNDGLVSGSTYGVAKSIYGFWALGVFLIFLCTVTYSHAGVDKSGVRPNVLSVPSGPGSIEGLGEAFESQLNTGTSSYSVPMKVPTGRNGFAPQLTLRYDSGNGNGIFGLGWRLAFPFISRQNNEGQPYYTEYPQGDGVDNDKDGETDEFDEFDTFVYSGREELLPTSGGFWRCENELNFVRFEKLSQGWIAKQKDGTTLKFGSTAASRVQDATGRVAIWCIDEMTDTSGNKIRFAYEKKDSSAQIYCTGIRYNQDEQMVITIEYEERPDIIVDYRPRFELKTAFRAKTITMSERGNLIRSYRLDYVPVDHSQPLSLLASIAYIGADGNSELPPASFDYVSYEGGLAQVMLMPNAPSVDLNNGNIDLLDLNGDALPDIIDTNQNPHGYYLNRGMQPDGTIEWDPFTLMTSNIHLYLGADTTELADMDGNVRVDMMNLFGSNVELFVVDENMEWKQEADIQGATFSISDPDVKLLDANNDRFIDVMQTTGSLNIVWISLDAKKWSGQYVASSPDSLLKFSRSETRLADMNGDRILDLVYLANNICYYYAGQGYGEYGSRVTMQDPPGQIIDNSRVFLVDVNGDGMSDAVHVGSEIRVWLNLGLTPSDHSMGRFAPSFSITTPYINAMTVFRRADVNGNGSIDIVLNTSIGGAMRLAYLDFASNEQAYQLKKITNGIGRTSTITYRSSVEDVVRDRENGREWQDSVPIPVPVVDTVEVSDGLATYTREFLYHDGYYDVETEEFRGFGRSEQREIGDTSIPDLVMCYQYDTGKAEDALKGRVLTLEAGVGPWSSQWPHYDGVDNDGDSFVDEEDEFDTGYLLYKEVNTWATKTVAESTPGDDRVVTMPYLQSKTRDVLEKGSGTPVQLQWAYETDDYGNITRKTEYGRTDAGWDDERVTVSSFTAAYPSGIEHWILDKLVEQSIEDENGTLVSRRRNYYDSSVVLGEVSRGHVTRVEDWIEGTEYAVTVRNQVDEYGNIVAVFDGLYGQKPGHYRELVFDPVYHTFPVSETIYTGNPSVPALTMSAVYDYRFGTITSSEDFNSHTTHYGYDTFGRLSSITKPYDTVPTVEYEYVLSHDLGGGTLINWIETRKRDGSVGDGTLRARRFYDGLGRTVMVRAEGEVPGQIVVTDTVQFNSRKLPWRRFLPYFETGTLDFVQPNFQTGFIEHFYDELGRSTRENQPVGPEGILYSTTNYTPLSKTIRDEEQTRAGADYFGCGMRYVEDGLLNGDGKGRLRQVVEIVKLTDTGEFSATPTEWQTAYSYDLLDNLTGYTDSQNNQKLVVYDGLGRRTFTNDPDRGVMYYSYDAAGNLIQTTDAKAQVIEYEYDGANRLTKEFYGQGHADPDVEYHYDVAAGPVSKGYLWNPDMSTAISDAVLQGDAGDIAVYDVNSDGILDVSDVVKAAREALADTFVTAENTLGYLSWVSDQSGEEHNSYDDRGRVKWVVKRIANSSRENQHNFYTEMAYDAMDRITMFTYPDQSAVTYTYNSRGLLESIPGVISEYNYNPAGQKALLQLACGTSTTYDYDHRLRLRRLRTVRSHDSLALQDLNYSFDGVSNITAVVDSRTDAELDGIGVELGIASAEARGFRDTRSFSYDSLYRLNLASSPSVYGTIRYRYDRIGNMIWKDATLLEPDALMDTGSITCGGTVGTSDRIGRIAGDQPGPHAITTTESGPAGPMFFTYDDNGNMLTNRGMRMSWDYKDRITTVENGTKTAQYVYDYSDTRKAKTVTDSFDDSTASTLYIDKFSEIRDGRLIKYVYAGNDRIANALSGMPPVADYQPFTFFLHDHLGSTNFAISVNGTVFEQVAYYPFGHQRRTSQFGLDEQFADYGFTGKEWDDESGLQYFEARFYDPVVGRFVRADPLVDELPKDWLENPQTLHIYSYVPNNPLKYFDPDGRQFQSIVRDPDGYVEGILLGAWNLITQAFCTLGESSTFGLTRPSRVTVSNDPLWGGVPHNTRANSEAVLANTAKSYIAAVAVMGDIAGKGSGGVKSLATETALALAETSVLVGGGSDKDANHARAIVQLGIGIYKTKSGIKAIYKSKDSIDRIIHGKDTFDAFKSVVDAMLELKSTTANEK